jgi:prephenate dehydratase
VPTVAYLGQPGTFSFEACLRFLPSYHPTGCGSFEEVIAAVRGGAATAGLLPTNNNAAGPTGAADLIARSRLRIVAEHQLAVRMQLLGLPETDLSSVTKVIGHPVALRQCAAFLSSLRVTKWEASDSSAAARAIDRPGLAALAPEAAAAIFGLRVIARDVHDRTDNLTRFALIVR